MRMNRWHVPSNLELMVGVDTIKVNGKPLKQCRICGRAEIHGPHLHRTCSDCGTTLPMRDTMQRWIDGELVTLCRKCG